MPEELIPPDSEIEFVGTAGSNRLVRFTSTATIADVTAFYNDALGEPILVDGESVNWSTAGPEDIITVNLTGSDGAVGVDVVIYGM